MFRMTARRFIFEVTSRRFIYPLMIAWLGRHFHAPPYMYTGLVFLFCEFTIFDWYAPPPPKPPKEDDGLVDFGTPKDD